MDSSRGVREQSLRETLVGGARLTASCGGIFGRGDLQRALAESTEQQMREHGNHALGDEALVRKVAERVNVMTEGEIVEGIRYVLGHPYLRPSMAFVAQSSVDPGRCVRHLKADDLPCHDEVLEKDLIAGES